MEEMNRKADAVFMTETLFDGQTEQGVELDHVLPDYYPEIFRILKCCLSPRVISAAVSGNKIMLDGVVLIKVLYLAENSTALHCVEQRYTWSKTVDIAGKAENLCGEPRITVVPRRLLQLPRGQQQEARYPRSDQLPHYRHLPCEIHPARSAGRHAGAHPGG
mgnify:CR=1 FL=1